MTDIELLAAIKQGNEVALAELYQRYYQRLARFLVRVTSDVDLSGEIINDVFLVIWQRADSFRGDSNPSTWIMGIGYNKALKALKRKKQTIALDDVPEPFTEPSSAGSEVEDGLAQLPPNHRAVIVLTYKFGYSYKEIGEILDCPENTVKTRMFHARKSLQKLLEVGK